MKFRIWNTEHYEYQSFADKYWTTLRKYGLQIKWVDDWVDWKVYCEKQEDGSDRYAITTIEIDSIEQLMQLKSELEHPIIVDIDEDAGPTIEIYDGYRE